jgi:protein gp37
MSSTSIQWTDHSINPIRARLRVPKPGDYVRKLNTAGVLDVAPPVVGGYGSGVGHYCEKISPGCAKCYASTSQKRFGMPEFPGASKSSPTPPTLDDQGVVVANETTEIFFDGSRLQEVLRRRKPTKFFWCDQTDLFGSWVPFEWIDRCFATMALTPWHTHQILTKRAGRMREYFKIGDERRSQICDAMNRLEEERRGPMERAMHDYGEPSPWPLPNVWLGTSVETQKDADERIPALLQCPAAVRFLSAEPLLGRIDLTEIQLPDGLAAQARLSVAHINCLTSSDDEHFYNDHAQVDWVIVGGESGPGARRCDVGWIRSIVQQCKSAGVPCFVKQFGSGHAHLHTRAGRGPQFEDGGKVYVIKDRKGGDPSEWPADLRVREMPEAEVAGAR